jgi:sporulation protein YlmC with PRC-barrel domain
MITMIRNLLATTAVATLIATGAMAQDNTQTTTQPAAPAATETMPADANQNAAATQMQGHLASNVIGENVYNGTGDNAEKIGDVNDMVVSNDGKVESLIIGVGGFLGIGEKNVAVEWGQLNWADQDGDRFLVMNTTKEQLEGLPDFDRRAYEPAAPATATDTTTAPADQTAQAPATDTTTTAPADQTAQAPAADTNAAAPADQTAQAPAADQNATAPADQTAQAPAADQNATDNNASTDTMATAAIDKSTLTPLDTANIRSEELVGTTVYGANDENVGEIGDVVLSQDGKVDAIIIDVGGFLGMGEKEVAVGMDNLSFLTDKDGNKYLYTNLTKEQLEAQAEYDKSTWAENRDQQRLIVQ